MTRQQTLDEMVQIAKRLTAIVDEIKQRKRALMSIGYGED